MLVDVCFKAYLLFETNTEESVLHFSVVHLFVIFTVFIRKVYHCFSVKKVVPLVVVNLSLLLDLHLVACILLDK